MKKFVFVPFGIAALGIAACSSNNQDTVNNAELNQPAADLNTEASDAANDAANSTAASLGNQEQQLQDQNAAAPAPDNTTNPSDDQEQNVSGM